MNTKVIDYLLSQGGLGILVIFLSIAVWFLLRQLTEMKEVVKSNTASNVQVANCLDKMASEVASSVKQSAEMNRAVLEGFVRRVVRDR